LLVDIHWNEPFFPAKAAASSDLGKTTGTIIMLALYIGVRIISFNCGRSDTSASQQDPAILVSTANPASASSGY